MMNSQVCSFGKLHANSPLLIRLSVCLLAEARLAPHWHRLVCQWKEWRRILIKAPEQIICHLINDWIYTGSLKWNWIFNHMWARWQGLCMFILLSTDQIQGYKEVYHLVYMYLFCSVNKSNPQSEAQSRVADDLIISSWVSIETLNLKFFFLAPFIRNVNSWIF